MCSCRACSTQDCCGIISTHLDWIIHTDVNHKTMPRLPLATLHSLNLSQACSTIYLIGPLTCSIDEIIPRAMWRTTSSKRQVTALGSNQCQKWRSYSSRFVQIARKLWLCGTGHISNEVMGQAFPDWPTSQASTCLPCFASAQRDNPLYNASQSLLVFSTSKHIFNICITSSRNHNKLLPTTSKSTSINHGSSLD